MELKPAILKVNKNDRQRVLASNVKTLKSNSRGPDELPDPFYEEATLLPKEVC